MGAEDDGGNEGRILIGLLFLWGALLSVIPAKAGIQTPDSLLSHAIAEGYWAATADSAANIHTGPVFRFHHIDVSDDRGYALEGFSVQGYAGETASRKNLETLQAEVKRHLLDHGFPFAVIHSRLTVDSLETTKVDVELRVHTGDAYKLGDLRVLETRTKPEVVRRLALWKIGEPFSERRMELGLKRLGRTGYYESSELAGLFRDSTRNLINPVLKLPDVQGNRLSGLLGYDSKAVNGGRLTGYVDLHLLNLFGTARDLDFTFESRVGNEREAHLAYVEPWLLGLSMGTRVEVDFLQQDTLFWEWNRNLIFFQDMSFNSRMEIQLGDQENSDAASGLHTRALKSGLRLIFDERDRVPLTTSGYRTEAGVMGLRRETGDSLYYLVQGTVGAQAWVPLTQRLGLKFGLHGATNLPLSRFNRGELYYVGGANSLRGYREREFATNAYVLGQAEMQLWMGRRGRLFAFTDPGLVNRLVAEYSWRRVIGYGVGMELSKGDWSLSLSYALSPERSPGDGLLHVGVDNRF